MNEVANIAEEAISPAPAMNQLDTATGFIDGVGKIENEILLLVDCKKLLKA